MTPHLTLHAITYHRCPEIRLLRESSSLVKDWNFLLLACHRKGTPKTTKWKNRKNRKNNPKTKSRKTTITPRPQGEQNLKCKVMVKRAEYQTERKAAHGGMSALGNLIYSPVLPTYRDFECRIRLRVVGYLPANDRYGSQETFSGCWMSPKCNGPSTITRLSVY